MFTGLVEEIGRVKDVIRRHGYQLLSINAYTVLSDLQQGDSIAVNGVCQTVTDIRERCFSVETLAESLKKTGLGSLKKGEKVNLERALTVGSRIGGNLVQGHVDGMGRIAAIRRKSDNLYLEITLPRKLARYCVTGGSIVVEGISLTIAAIRGNCITINIIPTTWHGTVLTDRKVGAHVNIEVDSIARYVAGMLAEYFSNQGRQV